MKPKTEGANHSDRSRTVIGLLCITLGAFPLSIALGLLPVDQSDVYAPMWVVAISGSVFVIAGCMIILGNHTWANDLLAGVLCLLFGVVGVWVALFSSSEGFSGGIPLLSNAANVTLARWVFGFGALISFSIAVYAFRRAFQLSR